MFYLAVPPEYFSVKTPGGIPPCRDLGNLFTPNKLKHPRSATWVICSQRTNQISLPEVPGVGHRTITRDLKRLGAMDQCADQRPWTGPLPSFYLAVPSEYFSVKTPGGIPVPRSW